MPALVIPAGLVTLPPWMSQRERGVAWHYIAPGRPQQNGFEWNRPAGQHAEAVGQVRRELEAAERKLGNLLDAVAEEVRGVGLQAKLSAAEAEVERLRLALAEAKPAPVRLLPDLGHAYRRTVERLREALNAGNNQEAVEAARVLTDSVIIHPTPRGTSPRITVEGHLAQMLTMAQPDLPPQAAKAIATAAELSVKEEPGGSAPGLHP